jgi:hypothetical protein
MRTRADSARVAASSVEETDGSLEATEVPLTRSDRIRAMREQLDAESLPARSGGSPVGAYARPQLLDDPPHSVGDARLEAREMLRELEEIEGAFASTRSAASARSSPVAPRASPSVDAEPVCDPRGPRGRSIWGEPSPYLEERMGGARAAASDLGKALGEIAERSGQLRVTVASLEDQLHRASREIEFLRTEEPATAPIPLPTSPVIVPATDTAVRQRPTAASAVTASAASLPNEASSSAPFAEYTTDRYNRSVGVLANQPKKIGATMIVLAAAISAVLMVITFLSHEPTPSAFLAGLPVIWMIPVPFFVVSFRGTQRVLRTTRMNLEGGF